MNKKLSGLVFVLIIAGCHSSQEGAVCPAPEASDPAAQEEQPPDLERTPELEADIERAKQHIRETRRRHP